MYSVCPFRTAQASPFFNVLSVASVASAISTSLLQTNQRTTRRDVEGEQLLTKSRVVESSRHCDTLGLGASHVNTGVQDLQLQKRGAGAGDVARKTVWTAEANTVIWELVLLGLIVPIGLAWRHSTAPRRKKHVSKLSHWKSAASTNVSNEISATRSRTDRSSPTMAADRDERSSLSANFHCCIKQGDVLGATRALEQLERFKIPPVLEDYNTMVSLCAKANQMAAANRWLKRIPAVGLSATPVCFNAVINGHAKHAEVAEAEAVVQQMLDAGVEPDTVTYNTLIDACARLDDANGAERWMQRMLDEGIKASVVSFASVMRACAKAGRAARADAWLSKADSLGMELNMICFSAVINAFAKRDDVDEAERWLARMKERNVMLSVHCYTGIMDSLLKTGDLERAARLVDDMRAAEVKPDKTMYNWIIPAATRAKRLAEAQAWASEAVALGVQLNKASRGALNAVANVPCGQASLEDCPGDVASGSHNSNRLGSASTCGANEEWQKCVGKKYVGTIKEFIAAKFGYIACDETFAHFKRDVFISSCDNPEGFMKGQRVCFTLRLDRRRRLPRASDLKALQPGS